MIRALKFYSRFFVARSYPLNFVGGIPLAGDLTLWQRRSRSTILPTTIPFMVGIKVVGNSIYYGNPINSSGAHVLDNLLAVAQQPAAFATILKIRFYFINFSMGKKEKRNFNSCIQEIPSVQIVLIFKKIIFVSFFL